MLPRTENIEKNFRGKCSNIPKTFGNQKRLGSICYQYNPHGLIVFLPCLKMPAGFDRCPAPPRGFCFLPCPQIFFFCPKAKYPSPVHPCWQPSDQQSSPSCPFHTFLTADSLPPRWGVDQPLSASFSLSLLLSARLHFLRLRLVLIHLFKEVVAEAQVVLASEALNNYMMAYLNHFR